MRDLIDRTALLDYMQRVLNHMRDDMLAAGNDAYLRGYASAMREVELAARVSAAPELLEALRFYADPSFDGYDVDVSDYGLSMKTGSIIKDAGDKARAAIAKAEAAE